MRTSVDLFTNRPSVVACAAYWLHTSPRALMRALHLVLFEQFLMNMKAQQIQPLNGTELMIVWTDGRISLLSNTLLQLNCRCAKCADEMTGERIIQDADVSADAKLLEVVTVGNYGVRFRWSKGCESGIYAYEYLEKLEAENLNRN